jgi:hypothetical protein
LPRSQRLYRHQDIKRHLMSFDAYDIKNMTYGSVGPQVIRFLAKNRIFGTFSINRWWYRKTLKIDEINSVDLMKIMQYGTNLMKSLKFLKLNFKKDNLLANFSSPKKIDWHNADFLVTKWTYIISQISPFTKSISEGGVGVGVYWLHCVSLWQLEMLINLYI